MIDNDLGDEGVAHLADSPTSDTLLELEPPLANALGDLAAKYLAKAKGLENLLELRLASNRFSKPAAASLADSPLGKRLLTLRMRNVRRSPAAPTRRVSEGDRPSLTRRVGAGNSQPEYQ